MDGAASRVSAPVPHWGLVRRWKWLVVRLLLTVVQNRRLSLRLATMQQVLDSESSERDDPLAAESPEPWVQEA